MSLGDETHILIRARTDKKRISTTVEEGEEAESFQAALAVELGANMTGLMKEKEGGKKSRGIGGGSEMEVVVLQNQEKGEEMPVSVATSKGGGGGRGGGGGGKKKRR